MKKPPKKPRPMKKGKKSPKPKGFAAKRKAY
jgi:hypothetical protein